jgi:hypothetical protein
VLDDVEKLTWKQVGFFMSGFDSFANTFAQKTLKTKNHIHSIRLSAYTLNLPT